MSWRESYLDIINQLKTDLVNLKDDEGNNVFDAVYVSRHARPTNFPCAFIFPERILERSATTTRSQYMMRVRIHVISKSPASEAGMKDAINRIGYVETMLINDRTFHGKVHNLEIAEIRPEAGRPLSRDRHEAELYVDFIWYVW